MSAATFPHNPHPPTHPRRRIHTSPSTNTRTQPRARTTHACTIYIPVVIRVKVAAVLVAVLERLRRDVVPCGGLEVVPEVVHPGPGRLPCAEAPREKQGSPKHERWSVGEAKRQCECHGGGSNDRLAVSAGLGPSVFLKTLRKDEVIQP